ncbi:MAG: hypothetical protein V1871_03100 [Planctomycetota bacterium]
MKKFLVIILCLAFTIIPALNCATILDGSKKDFERTSDIQWGYVILDVLIGGGVIGIIIDFSTGAIYKSSNPSKTEIEKNLNEGIPCYRLREDGVYKIELKDGQLKESKIEESAIPPVVWQTIEKEKTAGMVLAPQYAR